MIVSRQPITLQNIGITQSDSLNILGVIFNEKLNWKHHTNRVFKKANQRFHALRKVVKYLDAVDSHSIYAGTIRSLIEYSSPVFCGLNKSQAKLLNKIDRRAHKLIAGFHSTISCSCSKSTLKERRVAQSCQLFLIAEVQESHLLHNLVPERLPRSRRFRLPYTRTNTYSNSFFPYIARKLNKTQ